MQMAAGGGCVPDAPGDPSAAGGRGGGGSAARVQFVHVPAPLSRSRAAALLTYVWSLGSAGRSVARSMQGDAAAAVGRHNLQLAGRRAGLLQELQRVNALQGPREPLVL